jgi:hypothetical protein
MRRIGNRRRGRAQNDEVSGVLFARECRGVYREFVWKDNVAHYDAIASG